VNPGGIVIFDDLYWSGDMNRAWREIAASPRYSLTIDYGTKGVAAIDRRGSARHIDLCDVMGRPPIARPDW
jgi:hypothetical protein